VADKLNFTKDAVRAIANEAKATGERLRVYDERMRGLLVDASPAGSVAFYVRRKHKGRSIFVRLGDFGDQPQELTIEQARRKAGQVLAEFNGGGNPHALKQAERVEPTLRDLFERYIDEQKTAGKKTWEVQIAEFERNLGDGRGRLANRKASDISYDDVKRLKELLARNYGEITANRTLQLLRAIYNKAIKLRLYRGENPAFGVSLYKENSRDRFLSKEEIERFVAELQREPIRDTADFVWLALLTGARKSNILAMRFSEVDWSEQTWRIPETKNGRPQLVPLTMLELQILAQRQALRDDRGSTSDYVFEGKGRTGHLMDIKRSWTTFRDRANLLDITVHDLRRNLGSWMASANVNVALIKGALNHQDMKTTLKVYAKTKDQQQKEARLVAHEAILEAAGAKDLLRLVKDELHKPADAPLEPLSKRRGVN